MSNLIRGLSENGGVVFCGVNSTEIVRKAEQLHPHQQKAVALRHAANLFNLAVVEHINSNLYPFHVRHFISSLSMPLSGGQVLKVS